MYKKKEVHLGHSGAEDFGARTYGVVNVSIFILIGVILSLMRLNRKSNIF